MFKTKSGQKKKKEEEENS